MLIIDSLKSATSIHDIACLLGYSPSSLSYLIYKIPPEAKYTEFNIPKKNGGTREIRAPIDSLKRLQRCLARVLYDCRDQIDAANENHALSHGFRRRRSIITNASVHRNRRYVLNIDLEDFFPSFNFGRVRGFFIRNRNFLLNDKVATIVAQIAIYDNMLPQGSPCSPIIADLIAHRLDLALVGLAKKNRVTYSRYADDLTFSTNQKTFPGSIAKHIAQDSSGWALGVDLIGKIEDAGFAINPTKTRMQCKTGRQLVTGLTVNTKVNIRSDYYLRTRAMCHSLFETGAYHRPSQKAADVETISALGPIDGILSHVHHVKNLTDNRNETDKKDEKTSFRKLYYRFLFYRYFIALEKPLIICEGSTDNIYLKCAIRKSKKFHPQLGSHTEKGFSSKISFFKYNNKAHHLLEIDGGSGSLKNLILGYKDSFKKFKNKNSRYPVIILIDNDDGADNLLKAINGKHRTSITRKSSEPFYHITENLYLIKTPESGEDGTSSIEDLFDPELFDMEIDGKKFNRNKAHEADGEYGKTIFAQNVIRANYHNINFSNFEQLLERIVEVIDHFKQ